MDRVYVISYNLTIDNNRKQVKVGCYVLY